MIRLLQKYRIWRRDTHVKRLAKQNISGNELLDHPDVIYWQNKIDNIHLFGFYCTMCRRVSFSVKNRRLNTAYVDDELNFQCSCEKCYDASYDYYADLWSDYYSDCL